MEITSGTKAVEYLKSLPSAVKVIETDESEECLSCGILLSKEDMEKYHDDIDCLAHLEMMRKYYSIVG